MNRSAGRWKRFFTWSGGTLLVLVLLGGATFGLFLWRFLPFPPAPDFPPPADRAEARAQDIEQLRHLPDLDWSYDDAERKRFHAYLDRLTTVAADLSDAAFDLAVRRAAAITDNAHSNVSPVRQARSYPLLPVRLYRFAEGFVVVRAHETQADLLGTRLVSVDGTPPEVIAAQLATTIGGGVERRRYYEAVLLLAPVLLHADGLTRTPDRLTLSFQARDGTSIVRELEPLLSDQSPLSDPSAVRSPRRLSSETEAWRFVRPRGGVPRGLARRQEVAYHERLPGGDGLYVRVHRMAGDAVRDALRRALVELRTDTPGFVVIDLRDNPGGGARGTSFARAVPDVLGSRGRIYVLVNRGTFSAAMMFAALLKSHGGQRVTFVGESFGDRPQFWADGGSELRLPHSGIAIPLWRAYYDLEHGCPDWWKCFWPYLPGQPSAGELAIDRHVVPRFADLAAGRDTELQRILALESPAGARP